MKPNGETPPQAPTVLGSPGKPITDPELLHFIAEHRSAIENESKRFLELRNAMEKYDLARDLMHLATIRRDKRIQELAETQGKKPTS